MPSYPSLLLLATIPEHAPGQRDTHFTLALNKRLDPALPCKSYIGLFSDVPDQETAGGSDVGGASHNAYAHDGFGPCPWLPLAQQDASNQISTGTKSAYRDVGSMRRSKPRSSYCVVSIRFS
jgi:hypothetical protein